jgi:hypothetical protein
VRGGVNRDTALGKATVGHSDAKIARTTAGKSGEAVSPMTSACVY